MTAYLEGKLVMNATIIVDNVSWHQYSPLNHLLIDHIVFPPGVDIDNLYIYQKQSTVPLVTIRPNEIVNQLVDKSWLLIDSE